jgi:steroid delta-isomerase-like uncharacterized protein
MSNENNKTIARRFFLEAFSEGKLELLDRLLAADYVDHNAPPGTPPGVESIRYLVSTFRTAFPDVQFTVEDQVAEGDKVVTRYTFRGTHQGELFGIPATGKAVVFPGISIYRMQAGKMQEAWVNYDMMGMMQQLGVIPA